MDGHCSYKWVIKVKSVPFTPWLIEMLLLFLKIILISQHMYIYWRTNKRKRNIIFVVGGFNIDLKMQTTTQFNYININNRQHFPYRPPAFSSCYCDLFLIEVLAEIKITEMRFIYCVRVSHIKRSFSEFYCSLLLHIYPKAFRLNILFLF